MDMHAMVVDDSGIMRRMVMRCLTDSGLASFTFTEAVDGQDALTKFDPKVIKMMFVDWSMPNMTGIELVRKIRETAPTHVPIVMVTTEGTMGRLEEAINQGGVDAYIIKLFTPDVLRTKLEQLFGTLEAGRKSKGFFSQLAGKLV